jgi:hypothetical protein
MEAFLFSLGPPIMKSVIGLDSIQQNLMFLGAVAIYTYLYLLYRCKAKTPSKPKVSIGKTLAAMTPIFVYSIALFVLTYALMFTMNPKIYLAHKLLSLSITLWIISLALFYPSVRLSHGDCFPSIIGGIWNKIKNIFK